MAAPVTITFPAGPITSDAPLHIDANEGVVVNLPFLPWAPVPAAAGAPARASLTLVQAVRAFLSRCSRGPTPADEAAARGATAFRFRWTAAFWTRLLTELRDSGLFNTSLDSLRALDAKKRALQLVNPNNLLVVAADWQLTADFVIPAGAGAAATARRAIMAPMRYLHLVSAFALESPGSEEPWQRLCDLVSYLGNCCTAVAREDEAGLPCSAANTLREFVGSAALSDGVRARGVPPALDKLRLPAALRSPSVQEDALGQELDDGISFRSSDINKANVTEQRVHALGDRCGP